MKILALITMPFIALSLFACGDDSSTPTTQSLSNSSNVTWRQVKSEIVEPQGPPPKELVVKELRKGSGPVSRDGDELSVRYINFDYNTGDGYEERWKPPSPFTVVLGDGEALDAWETGLKGMAVKGRRALIVPKKDAYGKTPQVYVLELVSLNGSTNEAQSGKLTGGKRPKPKVKAPNGPPPKELVVEDLKKGSGTAVKAGDKIVVNYVGVNYKTGKEFETTWGNEPITYQLGIGEVIPGWEQGMKRMKVGGRRELIIPSELAFKNGAVIYVVDLLEVKKASPPRRQ